MKKDNNSMGKNKEAGANVLIRGHKCYRCGHEWRPRNLNEIPEVCPKCKSPYWKTKKKKSGENKK